jgi:hypothetical protein
MLLLTEFGLHIESACPKYGRPASGSPVQSQRIAGHWPGLEVRASTSLNRSYDPFFHARALKRPVWPESTTRALPRFRARASGELRREK